MPKLSPIALSLGYIRPGRDSATLCSKPACRLLWESKRQPSAVMGLLHSKHQSSEWGSLSKSKHYSSYTKLPLSARLQSPKQTQKCKIMHLPIVLRLPLPMEGLAVHFSLWWKWNFPRLPWSAQNVKNVSMSAIRQFQVKACFHQSYSQKFSATRMPFLIPARLLGHHDDFFGFSTKHATIYVKDCH